MKLHHPNPEEAYLGLRAMKMVAEREGRLTPAARHLLTAAQSHILHTDYELDTLPPITPGQLAEGFTRPELREQFVQGMVVVSLADDVPTPTQIQRMEQFAQALEVTQPAVQNIKFLTKKNSLLFRLDFMRRSHLRSMVADQFENQGFLGVVKGFLGLKGLLEEPELAAKYHRLQDLPMTTLGYQLWHHYHTNGFAFPGERYGFPEAAVYHDLFHVLGGYDTTIAGEIQVASFIAGFRRSYPLYLLMFVMLQFSAGVKVVPIETAPTQSVLATPGLADLLFQALERGTHVNTDLSEGWDFWPDLVQPLDKVREKFNILAISPN